MIKLLVELISFLEGKVGTDSDRTIGIIHEWTHQMSFLAVSSRYSCLASFIQQFLVVEKEHRSLSLLGLYQQKQNHIEFGHKFQEEQHLLGLNSCVNKLLG